MSKSDTPPDVAYAQETLSQITDPNGRVPVIQKIEKLDFIRHFILPENHPARTPLTIMEADLLHSAESAALDPETRTGYASDVAGELDATITRLQTEAQERNIVAFDLNDYDPSPSDSRIPAILAWHQEQEKALGQEIEALTGSLNQLAPIYVEAAENPGNLHRLRYVLSEGNWYLRIQNASPESKTDVRAALLIFADTYSDELTTTRASHDGLDLYRGAKELAESAKEGSVDQDSALMLLERGIAAAGRNGTFSPHLWARLAANPGPDGGSPSEAVRKFSAQQLAQTGFAHIKLGVQRPVKGQAGQRPEMSS